MKIDYKKLKEKIKPKISDVIDLVEGKKVFFEYYGNSFMIDREVPEYRHFNVPKSTELTWREEIIEDLLQQTNTITGEKLTSVVTILYGIQDPIQHVELLLSLLDTPHIDTFSSILYLEGLKREKLRIHNVNKYKVKHIENISEVISMIDDKIKDYKLVLLNGPIIVDQSYKAAYALKYYDFSDLNLIKRIESI